MQTALIIADDADFTRNVMGRWQAEPSVPEFTLVNGELWKNTPHAGYQLAIVGLVSAERLTSILSSLQSGDAPVIYIAEDSAAANEARSAHPRVIVLRQYDGWVDALVLLGAEVLKRVDVLAQLRRAEEQAASNQRQATLGRYMLDMRHSLNNALTSVLGNAELLLLEPGTFTAQVRDQIDTIHTMALRLHEIMQRFSSLESEMNVAEKSSQNETSHASHAYAIRF